MNSGLFIFFSIFYILLVFLIAYFADSQVKKGRSLVNNPYIYSLSLAVYCTAWTYYGSVGRSSATGMGFLPIYLGPTIIAPIWMLVLRKIIYISKTQRITSIADFISSRYGKNIGLGILVTIMSVLGVVPYISLQLKAVTSSFDILTNGVLRHSGEKFDTYSDSALYISIILTLFAILFGTRKADPNERHEGLVAAIAFESIVKLLAFLAVGFYVTYGIYHGLSDLFQKAGSDPAIQPLFQLPAAGIDGNEWFWLSLLSMFAVLMLPRQFHVAVVENTEPRFVSRAMWLFPLYMLLINFFVLPIAMAGVLQFRNSGIDADTFVLDLPLYHHQQWIALFVFIGGLSAAMGMVIVETIALSIMISNHIVLPFLITAPLNRFTGVGDLTIIIKWVRRVSIMAVILLSYLYFRAVGSSYALASMGLISFALVAQFAPSLLGGLYWKRGNRKGAVTGLVTGFIIWGITLSVPLLADAGIISGNFIQNGYFGISFLKPYSLFGLQGFSHIAHSAFWSLILNTGMYVWVSLITMPVAGEIKQADLFVNIYKYQMKTGEPDLIKREALTEDLIQMLIRFLGEERVSLLTEQYEKNTGINLLKLKKAPSELVSYIETHLAGVIGASSASIVIRSISKEDTISLDEMLSLLDQTKEIFQYSKALEMKSAELEITTQQLQEANEQLKALDQMKADFITTVTHELRTPITSIKALSSILHNYQLPKDKRDEYLSIIVSECDRLTRLINQVLDLEKIESPRGIGQFSEIQFDKLLEQSVQSLEQLMAEKGIAFSLISDQKKYLVKGDKDRLMQVIINLLSNAIKFCDPNAGEIMVRLKKEKKMLVLEVSDNGMGIAVKDQQLIFEKFTQVNQQYIGKPSGSGLGLFITKRIIELHNGEISVRNGDLKGATFTVKLPLLN